MLTITDNYQGEECDVVIASLTRSNKTADIDVFRTRYEMYVRCLLDDGSIENYSSAENEIAVEQEVEPSPA